MHAAARGQLQSTIAAALIEMGNFEVVERILTFSAQHNERRAGAPWSGVKECGGSVADGIGLCPSVRFQCPMPASV